MTMSPIAMGIEVVPTERCVIPATNDGAMFPSAMPSAIAENIQRVRYLSRKERRLRIGEAVMVGKRTHKQCIVSL